MISVLATTFSNSINTGAIVVAVLVTGAGGIATFRARNAKTWRDAFEAEQANRHLAESEAIEQRELKHAALAEIAALKLKTDITLVLKQMAADHTELMETLVAQQADGLTNAARMLAQTETRLNEQIQGIATSQVRSAELLERVAARVEKLENGVLG